ncbi:hypothetical protein EVA_06789 [gut metagenome]|uniref:Uncharacterized protein n=1 Tax=gut metagenome TaxID=749906 RepID=J9GDY5_9ZZZZ
MFESSFYRTAIDKIKGMTATRTIIPLSYSMSLLSKLHRAPPMKCIYNPFPH